MTTLTLREFQVDEDAFCLEFSGSFDTPETGNSTETCDSTETLKRVLEPFFDALEQYAGAWMPDVVVGERLYEYSRSAVWKALEERRDKYFTSIVLGRTAWPSVHLKSWFALTPSQPRLRMELSVAPPSFFTEQERCRQFVELVRTWACDYPSAHAFAGNGTDIALAGFPNFGRDDATRLRNGFDKIYEVFWLNIFGPRLVQQVGRERLLSTPAHRVEALPNGCVLLVTWPIAAHLIRPEARLAQARALVHLRPELDFDTVLRSLNERSAALVPVEPRFPPDAAPLLFHLLDYTSLSERQRKIAEFNARPPPEPEEWLPASAALPSDVPDTKTALEHYALMAEFLVSTLHSDLLSVFEQTPESLTDVDLHFWEFRYPEVFERDLIDARLVSAVGAYLGEVLVRRLGGQWIPRKKLEEAQVRVGTRVWLPFVRAHKYLRSCQSLVDFSLTQLFHAAQRHRGPP